MTMPDTKYAKQKRMREQNAARDLEIYRWWLSGEYSLAAIGEMYLKPDGKPLSAARVDQIVHRVAQEMKRRERKEGQP